ncbi:TSUP family transporter [Actinoplanes sp. NPDC049802]|uniref:TSUP family transporter n=1 Tax=Actinoplanes sp. NPDC049802 TaxID=3154742 RepID=UPI0033C9E084
MEIHDYAILLLIAAAAGWVDAVVGGGGLIQIPALMLGVPGMTPVMALGTNKLAAVVGTASAAVSYARRTKLNWPIVAPATVIATVFAGFGANAASRVPAEYFRPFTMALLVLVLVIVVARPSFGMTSAGGPARLRRQVGIVLLVGIVIGFYDGIFGPGTGTFLIMAFTTVLGLNFLSSSASAKFINAGTNLGALVVFAANDQVLLGLGIGMAVCNVIGAQIGTRTALKRGAKFVRTVLVVVVLGMVARLASYYI